MTASQTENDEDAGPIQSPLDWYDNHLIVKGDGWDVFRGEDYLQLPDKGLDHFSIRDAALMVALDRGHQGEIARPESAVDNWLCPDVYAAVEPLRKETQIALEKSVQDGHLKARIIRRQFPSLLPDPDRTYIKLRDLIEWLRGLDYEIGQVIEVEARSIASELSSIAMTVAQARSCFRHCADTHLRVDMARWSAPTDEISELRKQLDVARAANNELKSFIEQADTFRPLVGDRLSTRRERTLITIIAALCKKVGINPLARGAATDLARVTEDAGTAVGEDKLREIVKKIPDAVASRSS